MPKSEVLTKEAEEYATQGKFSMAIWLVENAFEIADASVVRKNAPVTFGIGQKRLRDLVGTCTPLIHRLDMLLEHRRPLLPEEWLLIVSDLSSCYAIFRFANRVPFSIDTPSLERTVMSLADATNNFALPIFRRQLAAARKRYPNPLPPPL